MPEAPAALDLDPSRSDDMAKTLAELAFDRHKAAIRSGDRAAFLANFAEDALLEDPLGPSPLDPSGEGHRGLEAIAAFWDRNLGPATVRFEIERGYAFGAELANVGTIYSSSPDIPGETVAEGVFVYRVDSEGQLVSIKGYWDFDKAMEARS